MARDPREERVALSALRRWMREHPGAVLFMGYVDHQDPVADIDECHVEMVTVDAGPYDLAEIATVALQRAQERFAAMADPDRRTIALRHVTAALAALWDTPPAGDA